MSCELKEHVCAMWDAFDKFAGGNEKLSKGELGKMMKPKMNEQLKVAKNPGPMKKMLEHLDEDGDGQLDFPEFMKAVGMLHCLMEGKACDIPPCMK